MLSLSPNLKLVIRKTLPIMFGLFAIMLVQLVDSIFIGMLGVNELAVQGITLPFQSLLIAIQVGFGVTATAIIARALGAKQFTKSCTIATMAVVFALFVIASLCFVLLILSDSVFAAFISPAITVQKFALLQSIFNHYWPAWLLSGFMVAALYLTTCVCRANGDNHTTGSLFFAASIINLILDPLLIFTLQLGITGAAVATTIGYASCTLYLIYKVHNKHWFTFIAANATNLDYFSKFIKMASTTIINQMLPAISAFIALFFISRIGSDAIAFWNLLSRIESFLLVFTLAITMSIPPIISRYLGSQQFDDIKDIVITTAKFLLFFHITIATLIALSSDLFIPLFTQPAILTTWLEKALWLVPFSYAPLGLCMMTVSVLNALGENSKALFVSFTRLFVFYIPAIWIGSTNGDLLDIIIAVTFANVMAGLWAWFKLSPLTIKTSFSDATLNTKTKQSILN